MLCQLSYTHHPSINSTPLANSIRAARAAIRSSGFSLRVGTVARQKGLEPLTHGLEGRCSIHLSYWRDRGEPI
jgi:hypothetical protein